MKNEYWWIIVRMAEWIDDVFQHGNNLPSKKLKNVWNIYICETATWPLLNDDELEWKSRDIRWKIDSVNMKKEEFILPGVLSK